MKHRLFSPTLLLLISSCGVLFPSSTNDLFCDEATTCSDPSFCDLNGVYSGSDLTANTCIAPPEGVCANDANCSGAAPICGDLQRANFFGDEFTVTECRACTAGAAGDSECMTKDATAPICESGACLECRTSAECTADPSEPRCDTETGQCVGCVENSDCPSEVCVADAGQCEDAADIVYVATDGIDGAACGSQASRCKTIAGPQGGLDKVTDTRKTLKLADDTYAESVVINALVVAIVGPATVNPPVDGQPAFSLTATASAVLEDLTATGATGNTAADGIRCDNSTLVLSKSSVTLNADVGIQADGCNLTISQSNISQNTAGGLDINASSFDIQNNFIVSNGTAGAAGSGFGGMQILGATQTSDVLSFNTVADNTSATGAASSGVDCQLPSQMQASSNIVYLSTGTPIRANCNLTHSNIEGGAPGTGNIDADPMFVNPAQRNYHLQPGSPCIDMADPAANLAIDVDGDRRPQGNRHDIGADEVVP